MKTLQTGLLLVWLLVMVESCTRSEMDGLLDPEMKIAVSQDEDLFGSVQITLENSLYKAVLKSSGPHHKQREDGPMFWHNIRSWVFKSHSIDQAIGVGIDCNHFRGNCYKTEMLQDGDDRKSIRLYYHADARYILAETDIDSSVTRIASEYQQERPPYVGYIFLFDCGLDNAIEMGKAIAGGDMLIRH